MAKISKPDEAQSFTPAEAPGPEKLQPTSVVPAEDPAKNAIEEIPMAFGEVLLVSIDSNGNDTGEPFKVSNSTYSKYYSDETRFRLKKNHE